MAQLLLAVAVQRTQRESHRRGTVVWQGGHSSAARMGESSSFSTSPLVGGAYSRRRCCAFVFVLAIYRTDIYRHREDEDNNKDGSSSIRLLDVRINCCVLFSVAKERTRNAAVTKQNTRTSTAATHAKRKRMLTHPLSVYRTCTFVVHTKVCRASLCGPLRCAVGCISSRGSLQCVRSSCKLCLVSFHPGEKLKARSCVVAHRLLS